MAATAAALALSLLLLPPAQCKPPHIVLIVADDLVRPVEDTPYTLPCYRCCRAGTM